MAGNVIRNMQIRYNVPEGHIAGFECNGKAYVIENVSHRRHLIPASTNFWWVTEQYVAREVSTGKLVEVYVYYYMSFEGVRYAVVDAMEEVE